MASKISPNFIAQSILAAICNFTCVLDAYIHEKFIVRFNMNTGQLRNLIPEANLNWWTFIADPAVEAGSFKVRRGN